MRSFLALAPGTVRATKDWLGLLLRQHFNLYAASRQLFGKRCFRWPEDPLHWSVVRSGRRSLLRILGLLHSGGAIIQFIESLICCILPFPPTLPRAST